MERADRKRFSRELLRELLASIIDRIGRTEWAVVFIFLQGKCEK